MRVSSFFFFSAPALRQPRNPKRNQRFRFSHFSFAFAFSSKRSTRDTSSVVTSCQEMLKSISRNRFLRSSSHAFLLRHMSANASDSASLRCFSLDGEPSGRARLRWFLRRSYPRSSSETHGTSFPLAADDALRPLRRPHRPADHRR